VGLNPPISVDPDDLGNAALFQFSGTEWSDGDLAADVEGIYISLSTDGFLQTGALFGEAIGSYIEVDEGGGEWQASAVGQFEDWVEVETLLELVDLLDDIENIEGLNIPITEIYHGLLDGSGAFGAGGALDITSAVIGFVALDLDLNGLWAAFFNGTYTNPTSNNWSLDVSGDLFDSAEQLVGDVDLTLTGTSWNGNNWTADISGSTSTGYSLDGIAGGTYDEATFQGGATGTFVEEE